MSIIIYKGYEIDTTTYNCISVFVAGDDFIFGSIDEAKRFIDGLEG